MSTQHASHAGHAFHTALAVPGQLKPFAEYKDPNTAALCGFLFGGIGLGVYFKNFQDFVLPVVLWILCALFAPITIGTSWLAAGTFCAIYGYRRAKASNERLAASFAASTPPPVPSSRPTFQTMPPVIEVTAIPTTRIHTPTATESADGNGRRAARLRELMELRHAGLISETDYQAKLQQILGDL